MRLTALAIGALLLASLGSASGQSLSSSSIGPGERPEAFLSLPAAGRVSLRASSSSGVPISLYDKMEGRIAADGLTGKRDGRIDLSLDAGEYKLLVEAADSAGKPIALSASAFRETSGASPLSWPRLLPGRTQSRQLSDLETASFWIELPEDGAIEVEALGRNLVEAELWEGPYLLGSWKPREERAVEEGRPMGWLAVSRPAKAGTYLLKLHGGPGRVWAREEASRPLHVRAGFLSVPLGGQFEHRISAFGRDFFYTEDSGLVLLSRRAKEEARLSLSRYSPGASRLERSGTRELSSSSTELSAALGLRGGPSLIVLEGRPGEAFSLGLGQDPEDLVFEGRSYESGALLSLHQPRAPEPSIEPSGLLLAYDESGRSARVLRDFAIPLSGESVLRRRHNLGREAEFSLYLRVEEEGSYRVAEKRGTGQAQALYSLARLDARFQPSGYVQAQGVDKALFELGEGYYLLTVRAASLGVLDFLLYKPSLARRPELELGKEPPPLPSARSTSLGAGELRGRIRLLAGGSPTALAALEAFPLPLERGLSLELGPGEGLNLPVNLGRASRASLRGGSALLSLDGQALQEGGRIEAGGGRLALRNPGKEDLRAALSLEPVLPAFGEAELRAFLADRPPLALGTPAWLDLGRREKAVYSFEVKEAAIYVVESLGRLSTSLTIRSGSRLKLFTARENGYGRNASLRTWLRPGRYSLELETLGESAGRCGLRLDRVPLEAELALEPGAVDRRSQAADAATRFRFSLAAEAELELRSVGLTGLYPVRLEDERGYLLYAGQGRTRQRLPAGRYALYSLPLSIDTRRLTWLSLLDPPPPAPPLPGTRGLEFGRGIEALWEGRSEWDRYSFRVPAAMRLSLELDQGLEARLLGAGGERELPAAERGEFRLERGSWELRVRPREATAKLPYGLGLRALDLAPGLISRVSLGGEALELSVAVPEDGDYEFWSLGRSDLRASLYPEGSTERIALADDAGPDWNFSLLSRLRAGRYRLRLESLGGAEREAEIRMVSRIAASLPAAALPRSGESRLGLALNEAGVLLPLEAAAEEGVYLFRAEAEAPVSLRLYRGEELLASGEGSLALPLAKGLSYRLQAWAPLPLPARLLIVRLPERRALLGRAGAGSAGTELERAALDLAAGELLRLGNPEGLSAQASRGDLLVSAGLERPFLPAAEAPFSFMAAGGWAWAPEAPARIESLLLSPGQGRVLSLGETEQGFLASSPDRALLLRGDSRGQFRLGLSALPAGRAGPPPKTWGGTAPWSQGSLALLPPGAWKLGLWDGQALPGLQRKSSLGLEALELRRLPAPSLGARESLSLAPGEALSLELPATSLQALLGEGLLLSAWREGEALASRSSLDGRRAESLELPASTLLVANLGSREASLRLALLPPREAALGELSASRPFEALALPPEGARLRLRAAPGELLCLAGDALTVELAADDGRYREKGHDPRAALITSLPAASGELRIRSGGGLVRAWLAAPGRELEGLLESRGQGSGRELRDSVLLSDRGEAFTLRLARAGYVDLSCPGPGLLSLSGPGRETQVELSGSREDMHLFAWLPPGEYGVWRRPAAGQGGGGILRVDRIASAPLEAAEGSSFIAAREYQAWSFSVKAPGLVGIGVKAEADGLEAFLYDGRQGRLARGRLMFEELEAGDYLLVVKGLEASPIEYRVVLEGVEGSRLGIPPAELEAYQDEGGGGSSVEVPMRYRGGGQSSSEEAFEGEYLEGEYLEDEYAEDEYAEELGGEALDEDYESEK